MIEGLDWIWRKIILCYLNYYFDKENNDILFLLIEFPKLGYDCVSLVTKHTYIYIHIYIKKEKEIVSFETLIFIWSKHKTSYFLFLSIFLSFLFDFRSYCSPPELLFRRYCSSPENTIHRRSYYSQVLFTDFKNFSRKFYLFSDLKIW